MNGKMKWLLVTAVMLLAGCGNEPEMNEADRAYLRQLEEAEADFEREREAYRQMAAEARRRLDEQEPYGVWASKGASSERENRESQ